MTNIPEITIYKILKNILLQLREDVDKSVEESFIKQFLVDFQGDSIKIEDKDYLKEALKIFRKEEGNARKPDVYIGYNTHRQNIPTIHIMLPNESSGISDGIGMDEGYVEGLEFNGTYRGNKTRSFQANYNIVISSDNMIETVVMYHVIRAYFIAIVEDFDIKGIRNLKIDGEDIRINSDLVPISIYHRALKLSFFYESTVPNINANIIASDIVPDAKNI